MQKHIILLFSISLSFSQIAGLSGSKLVSFCVDVVDHHKVELEPSFGMSSSSQFWNANGRLVNQYNSSDSVSTGSNAALRITYGLFNTTEIGVTFPTDGSSSNWGVRHVLSDDTELDFAIMAGLQIPFGNDVFDRTIKTEENTLMFGAGLVTSYEISENTSLDANLQYNTFSETLDNSINSFLNMSADIGHYVFSKQLQCIAAISYQTISSENKDSYLVTFHPGFTIESGANYIIVLNGSYDVAGENIDKSYGFGMALTLTFE